MSRKTRASLTQEQIDQLHVLKDARERSLMEKQVVDAVYGGRRKGAQKKMEAAQEKYQLANDAYKKYYTKLGMTRQSAWQVDRTSRGLCRLCSKEADYGGMCNVCRDKQRQHLEKVQAKRRESHGIV